ncbi:MAG: hypothetical protein ACLQIB_49475 [Isosphaeraceae bacterium]
MENITDPSFNTEEIASSSKPSGAAQPMVVVQYKARGVPWWLLSLLTIFAPVCAILIYHSLVVGRYRAQAVETAEALRTKLDGARPPAEVKKTPEEALALNSQPIVAPAPPASLTAPSNGAPSPSREQGGSVASTVSPAGPAGPDAGHASGDSAGAQKGAAAAAPGGNRSATPTGVDVAETTPGAATRPGRVSAPAGDPAVAAKAAGRTAAARPESGGDSRPPNSSATATAALQFAERNKDRRPASDRRPFDDPSEKSEPLNPARPGDIAPANASSPPPQPKVAAAKPVGEPRAAGIPPAQQPLPTPEEEMRQIEEEAAHNEAQKRDQQEKQAVELRSVRYQERVKFRDELRAILQEHGNSAGPEINQLAKRSSFEKDPERQIQATRIWRFSRNSQANKVKMIRALDMPEAVILDFLSDDFHAQVRAPKGPRNENEVRIRAAHRLLQLELPPEDAMPVARPPADPMPGRTLRSRVSPLTSGPGQRGR